MHLKHQGKCHIKIDKNSHSNKDLPHESASVFHRTTKLGSTPTLKVRASLQQVFFLVLLAKDLRECPFAEQTLNPLLIVESSRKRDHCVVAVSTPRACVDQSSESDQINILENNLKQCSKSRRLLLLLPLTTLNKAKGLHDNRTLVPV